MNDEDDQLDLFTPPANDMDGETYEAAFDYERLNAQLRRVYDAMKDGRFRTLREISDLTGDPESSISARLRDFRKAKFGRLGVARQRRGERPGGLFEYSVRAA